MRTLSCGSGLFNEGPFMSIAVFMLVQNEPLEFVERWYAHYAPIVGRENLYALNHGCTGDYESGLYSALAGANVVTVQHVWSYDHAWMIDVVRSFQTFLLSSYDAVIFASPDEFLVHNSGDPARLEAWLDAFVRDTSDVRPGCYVPGYEVIHQRDREPCFNHVYGPWLKTRSQYYLSPRHTRPAISRAPLKYSNEFSEATNLSKRDVSNAAFELSLLHMGKADYPIALRKHQDTASRRWNPTTTAKSRYAHWLDDDPEKVEQWMLSDSDNGRPAETSPIPQNFRNLL